MELFFVSSTMIIHFGRKPVSGGRPPRERRITRDVEVKRGSLFHVFESIMIEVVERMCIVKNIEVVRRM